MPSRAPAPSDAASLECTSGPKRAALAAPGSAPRRITRSVGDAPPAHIPIEPVTPPGRRAWRPQRAQQPLKSACCPFVLQALTSNASPTAQAVHTAQVARTPTCTILRHPPCARGAQRSTCTEGCQSGAQRTWPCNQPFRRALQRRPAPDRLLLRVASHPGEALPKHTRRSARRGARARALMKNRSLFFTALLATCLLSAHLSLSALSARRRQQVRAWVCGTRDRAHVSAQGRPRQRERYAEGCAAHEGERCGEQCPPLHARSMPARQARAHRGRRREKHACAGLRCAHRAWLRRCLRSRHTVSHGCAQRGGCCRGCCRGCCPPPCASPTPSHCNDTTRLQHSHRKLIRSADTPTPCQQQPACG